MAYRRKFMERAAYCELYGLILPILRDDRKLWGFFGGELPPMVPKACDPHHVMLATSRWDDRRNLLALCRPVHDIVEARSKESFVWCLYRLDRVGRLDLRWMAEKMRHPLPSYLEAFDTSDWHPLSVKWRDKLAKKYRYLSM